MVINRSTIASGLRREAASKGEEGGSRPRPQPVLDALEQDTRPRPARPSRWDHRVLSLLLSDTAALCLSALIGMALLTLFAPFRRGPLRPPQDLVFVPMFVLALAIHGSYRKSPPRLVSSVGATLFEVGQCLATGVLLALALDSFVWPDIGEAEHRALTLSQAVALGLPALVLIPVFRVVVQRVRSSRAESGARRILIAGSGRVADAVATRLDRAGELTVVGMVDDDPAPGAKTIGTFADLPEMVRDLRIDRVLVAFSRTPPHEVVDTLYGMVGDVAISVVPRLYEILSWRSGIEELSGIPLINVAHSQLSPLSRMVKRAFDVLGSLLAMVVLLPVAAAAAVAIKLDSPGPVFFRQARTGRDGEPFLIYKFRTMELDASDRRDALSSSNEVDGPIFKIRSDPRVTRVGGFLRRTSIDELPQLINVLFGQMSLVGPRPFPVHESEQIGGRAASRFDVLPGMTGLWQVSGRSDLTFDDLRHLDSIYVASWSLWWDLRIILQTPVSVLRGRGAC
jgi:exopolysaccharide biosynthesis polyprenyl glycosylphosphotransferase